MCDICKQFHCPAACPNAPEPKSVFICSGCGENIYEGDEYYDLMGEQFCRDCIDGARKEAKYVTEDEAY